MKKTVMVIVTMALVVLMAEPAAFAQDTPDPQDTRPLLGRGYRNAGTGFGPGAGYLWMTQELGLTADQLTKLQAMRVENQKEMIQIRADLQLKYLELAELMKAQGNDDAVKAKHAEIQAIMTQMSAMRLNHRLGHRSIFTAEQWQKLSTLRGNFRNGMGRGNYGNRMGGRGNYGMRGRSGMRGNRSFARGNRVPRGGYYR